MKRIWSGIVATAAFAASAHAQSPMIQPKLAELQPAKYSVPLCSLKAQGAVNKGVDALRKAFDPKEDRAARLDESTVLIGFAVACERLGDGGLITTHYLTAAGVVLGLSLVENAFSLAFEDALTGLPARRALEETLVHLVGTYAIAMVDLDHFKKVNDRHGHDVGDQVLKMVAAKLARIGGGGRAFRYGGEEFAVVFAGKTAAEALPHLEDLREDVAEKPFAVRAPDRPAKKPKTGRGRGAAGKTLRVTLSVGLAERTDKRPSPGDVLEAADKALYRSKKAGRNRVTVAR